MDLLDSHMAQDLQKVRTVCAQSVSPHENLFGYNFFVNYQNQAKYFHDKTIHNFYHIYCFRGANFIAVGIIR